VRPDFGVVESQLLELAKQVRLAGSPARLFQEFIDHGEYGLALEELGIGLYSHGRAPSENELSAFRRIAVAMSQDAEEYLRDARVRAQRVTANEVGSTSEGDRFDNS